MRIRNRSQTHSETDRLLLKRFTAKRRKWTELNDDVHELASYEARAIHPHKIPRLGWSVNEPMYVRVYVTLYWSGFWFVKKLGQIPQKVSSSSWTHFIIGPIVKPPQKHQPPLPFPFQPNDNRSNELICFVLHDKWKTKDINNKLQCYCKYWTK